MDPWHSSSSTYEIMLLTPENSGFRVLSHTVRENIPEFINLNGHNTPEVFFSGPIVNQINQLVGIPPELLQLLHQAKFTNVLLLPIIQDGQLKALFIVGSQFSSPIKQEAIEAFAGMAEFLLTAIERNNGDPSIRIRLREMDAIVAASQALTSVADLDLLFTIIHEQVRQFLGEYGFLIAFYDSETNSIRIPYMFEPTGNGERISIEPFHLGEGLTSILIRTKQPLMIVENTEIRAAELGAKIIGKAAKSWLGAPLILANNVIGALVVQDTEREKAFNDDDLRFITSLAAQAAGVINNIRLVDEAHNRALHLQTAAEIARDISLSLDLGELLVKSVNLIRERFNFYHAAIFLVDTSGEFVIIREATGDAGMQMKLAGHKLRIGSKSIVGHTTASGKYLVVNDTNKDATFLPNPLLPETRSEVAIPLQIGHRILGALDVQSNMVYAFTKEDINVLQILADQLASAVINSELFSETQEHLSQHRLLHHVTTAAASGTTLQEARNSAAQGLQVTLGGDRVAILLADRARKILVVEAIAGYSDEVKSVEVPIGEGITGWVALHQQSLRIDDVSQDDRYIEVGSNVSSELAIPLSYRGELLGVLNVESDKAGAYSKNDEELLGTLGGSLAAIISNARLIEQIRHQAERERLLYELTTKIRRSTDMHSIMVTTTTELCKALGANRANIKIGLEQQSSE